MTKEDFQKQLKKKYPVLYKNLGNKKSMSGGFVLPIAFGIECGEGWYNLIDYVSSKLESLYQDIEVVQVKEKFGGIRIYTNKDTLEAGKIIEFAEKESENTCEMCGKKGQMMNYSGWYKTRCHKCKDKKW